MYYIGIDLGGTNIVAGVVDEHYNIVGKGKLKTRLPRPQDEILAELSEAAKLAIEDAGVLSSDIEWVGVGSPGTVNSDTGVVEYANNLAFKRADIRSAVESALKLPCFVANDANAAAYGELCAGAGKGVSNFIAITLGTGVGGGVIIDGKMLTGFNHAGGELGHMSICADGLPCNCGNIGCLEAYASATALIRRTKEAMEADKASKLWEAAGGDIQNVSARTAFDAMRMGDDAAKSVVDNYIKYLAAGVVSFINVFQPEIICIGGGVSHEDEKYLLNPLCKMVSSRSYGGDLSEQTKIMTATLGNDAGIIGAAMLGKLEK